MTKGLNRSILSLAVPSILANVTVPLVGLVDMAVAGHLDASGAMSSASFIAGVAVGSMLFDLMYWNFGFLRVGTGGLAAQAYGRGDTIEAATVFTRGISLALLCSVFLIAIQWLFVKGALLLVDCSPEAAELASRYFFIRIWAAPATLSLMVFKGWFIGMQDGVSPMVTDIVVNVMNILMSIGLAVGFDAGPVSFAGIGFDGIALGTVLGQYSGLLCAVLILVARYGRKIFAVWRPVDMLHVFSGSGTRRFFSMNLDLFIRSLCLICIYVGFTTVSARFGDVVLAASSILMKLMMLFSYFSDGFAYAGEALAGKCIGEKDEEGLRNTVRCIFSWSMSVGIVSVAAYAFGTVPMLSTMTSDQAVMDMARQYVPWLMVMPVAGCAAFTWDGIYIGATESRTMRDAMLWSTLMFFIFCFGYMALAPAEGGTLTAKGEAALHGLFLGYVAHLVMRALYLSAGYRKHILQKAA